MPQGPRAPPISANTCRSLVLASPLMPAAILSATFLPPPPQGHPCHPCAHPDCLSSPPHGSPPLLSCTDDPIRPLCVPHHLPADHEDGMASPVGKALFKKAGELMMTVGFMCYNGLLPQVRACAHTHAHARGHMRVGRRMRSLRRRSMAYECAVPVAEYWIICLGHKRGSPCNQGLLGVVRV